MPKFQLYAPVHLAPVRTERWEGRTVGLGVLGKKQTLVLAWKILALKFVEAHCTQTVLILSDNYPLLPLAVRVGGRR